MQHLFHCHWSLKEFLKVQHAPPKNQISTSKEEGELDIGEVTSICCHKLFVVLTYYIHFTTVHAKSLQVCPTPCDPMDCSHQAPLTIDISKQEYWSGLPCPPPGMGCHTLLQEIFLTQGLNLSFLRFLHWQVASLPLAPFGKPPFYLLDFNPVVLSQGQFCPLKNTDNLWVIPGYHS